jgi:hypothetical protein
MPAMIVRDDGEAAGNTVSRKPIVACGVLTEPVENMHECAGFALRLPAIHQNAMSVRSFQHEPIAHGVFQVPHSPSPHIFNISMKVYDADQVMKVNPAIASVPVMKRMVPSGTMSPKPTVVNVVAE